MKPSSLYIHIPYCRSKCIYCDFFSGGSQQAQWDLYVSQILDELSVRNNELTDKIISIYIGGGTPSLMPVSNLEFLLKEIRNNLTGRLTETAEITLEINPEDVTEENVDRWLSSGINRSSIGLQSFSEDVLKLIGRRHSGKEGRRAVKFLKSKFKNVSADLIFGLPGQSIDSFKSDLKELIDMEIPHISCYSLMYEEGTALYELRRQNRITDIPENYSLEMYSYLSEELKKNGFSHYEISNFAKPGFESIHNSGYWSGRPYLGLGPSAHSYDGYNSRKSNPWKLKDYLHHKFKESGNIFFEEETLTRNELIEEMIMLSLRTQRGLNLREFERRFGKESSELLINKSEPFINIGNLEFHNDSLRLTNKGILISDSIISSLF